MRPTTHTPASSRSWIAVIPAVVVALLPRLLCPCQLPAYAAILGWLGLAFLLDTTYLLPLTTACLTLAVGGLAVEARQRRGWRPFCLGLVGAVGIFAGKFALGSSPVSHIGLGALLAATLWNAWPLPRRRWRFTPDGQVESLTSNP